MKGVFDLWTDESSPKQIWKIAVGVCEVCKVPVMDYKLSDQPWPERYDHGETRNRLLFIEDQRVAP